MRRFATVLAASAIMLVGGGSVASAGTGDYPPGDDAVLLLSSSVVGPGEEFTATLEGCTDGETVTFTVEGDSATATSSGGSASATLTAPSAEGTYTVTGTCDTSGVTASAELVVDAGDDVGGGTLPPTGAGAAGTFGQVGAGLIVGGLGLLTVARLRRRRPITA